MPRQNIRRFNSDEKIYLGSWYRALGPTACAKRLGRSISSVKHYASRAGLVFGERRGMVTLGLVCQATGMCHNDVRKWAERDGVVKVLVSAGGRKLLLVPEVWADAFVADAERRTDADADTTLWRVADIAEHYSVCLKTVYQGTHGRGRFRALAQLEPKLGRRSNKLYDPLAVKEALRMPS